jgi:hypothetical protein
LEDIDEFQLRKDRLILLRLLDSLDSDELSKDEKNEVTKMENENSGNWTESFKRKGVGLDFNREDGILARKAREHAIKDEQAKQEKLAKRAKFAKKCEKDTSMISKADR